MSRPTMGQERQAGPAGSSDGAPPQRKTMAWLLVALLIGVSGLAAWKLLSPSVTWHDDLYAASELAEKQSKPVLVLYTADWCPPCQTLKTEVLSDPDIVAYLSEHFVCVKMDLTSGMGPAAMHAVECGVQSIPTIHVFDRQGEPLGQRGGSNSPTEFMEWLKSIRAR